MEDGVEQGALPRAAAPEEPDVDGLEVKLGAEGRDAVPGRTEVGTRRIPPQLVQIPGEFSPCQVQYLHPKGLFPKHRPCSLSTVSHLPAPSPGEPVPKWEQLWSSALTPP